MILYADHYMTWMDIVAFVVVGLLGLDPSLSEESSEWSGILLIVAFLVFFLLFFFFGAILSFLSQNIFQLQID